MDNLILAYLAGVMDSDGYFGLIRKATNILFPECITVSEACGAGQVDPVAVKMLQGLFGGTMKLRKRKNHPTWRPIHYWYATNKHAALCASTLLPFLRIKRRQAEILTLIRQSKNTRGLRTVRVGVRGTKLAPEVATYRDDLYREMRLLNKPGVDV